jgi:putative SOS response-associated peptidase YedK
VCGRYTLSTPGDTLTEVFELAEGVEVPPRYNIAPTDQVPVVRVHRSGERRLHLFRWGLVPAWARDPEIGNRLINARSETVATKAAFRDGFRWRRCLVPADGFYEWRKSGATKQPMLVHLAERAPFAMAGIWARWQRPDGAPLLSFALITTQANELVARLHDRMPVILPTEDWALWLDPGVEDADRLQALLRPFEPAPMAAYPVSSLVNSVQNEGPQCIQRVEEPPVQGTLF